MDRVLKDDLKFLIFLIKALNDSILLPTQVHGLLRWVCGDAPKHDAGQHGAQQKGKTARHSLHTRESAARRSTDDREPDVAISEILGCLHEEQVAKIFNHSINRNSSQNNN